MIVACYCDQTQFYFDANLRQSAQFAKRCIYLPDSSSGVLELECKNRPQIQHSCPIPRLFPCSTQVLPRFFPPFTQVHMLRSLMELVQRPSSQIPLLWDFCPSRQNSENLIAPRLQLQETARSGPPSEQLRKVVLFSNHIRLTFHRLFATLLITRVTQIRVKFSMRGVLK